jgi:hypothetical protein
VPVARPEVSPAAASSKGAIATNIELSKPSFVAAAAGSKPVPAPVSLPSEGTTTPTARAEGPSQGRKRSIAAYCLPAQHSLTLPLFSAAAIPHIGEDGSIENASPGSPYTSSRLMIQNMTLPTVPNLNIPPSPPGSPPRRSTQKFAQFLELKKKGQHFNQRLENSSVVRDPNHSSKLMDFASVCSDKTDTSALLANLSQITEEDQYASTLPEGLGVPVTWPDWAYGDALNASQKKITKAKESERSRMPRGSVDFVPARSGTSSGTGTPSGKGLRQSAAERAIAGSDSRPREKR